MPGLPLERGAQNAGARGPCLGSRVGPQVWEAGSGRQGTRSPGGRRFSRLELALWSQGALDPRRGALGTRTRKDGSPPARGGGPASWSPAEGALRDGHASGVAGRWASLAH